MIKGKENKRVTLSLLNNFNRNPRTKIDTGDAKDEYLFTINLIAEFFHSRVSCHSRLSGKTVCNEQHKWVCDVFMIFGA